MLIFLDTETGGIPNGVSILTITISQIEFSNNKIINHSNLDIKCLPDDNLVLVSPEALSVNKIDLVEHSKTAISYKDAGREIYKYLSTLSQSHGKLTLVGQGIQFDLRHLFDQKIISEASFYNFVDRRVIDIISISKFAQELGKIPKDQSISLANIAKYLKIPVDQSALHTSLGDNLLAAKVLFELGKLFNGKP